MRETCPYNTCYKLVDLCDTTTLVHGLNFDGTKVKQQIVWNPENENDDSLL